MIDPLSDSSDSSDSPEPEDLLAVLTRVVQAERGRLAALARGEGLGAEDAVDCVQEALCAVLTRQHGTHGHDAPLAPHEHPRDEAGWAALLSTYVRNAARNGRRRHFRARPHAPLDDERATGGDDLSADEAIARAEEHVRLRACVAELCEIQKAVVTLRMLDERPGDDVARALGITPGHVAVLLHRAKGALRACMANV